MNISDMCKSFCHVISRKIIGACILCIMVFPVVLEAETQYGLTLDGVGVSISNNTAHFWVKESLTLQCKWNVVYIKLASEAGKAAYSTILAAKASGKQVRRVVYSQNDANDPELCYAGLIEISD